MAKKILTKSQEKFLALFQKYPVLFSQFTLSGGTALAAFYLHHRYSEDLDFFSIKEFDPKDIFPLLSTFKQGLGFQKLEHQQSFNRNLYFFTKKNEILKTEFTYFPFEPVSKPFALQKLKVDSLKDIAVNKVFTIYQKPRMRDFIDLYVILRNKKWTVNYLMQFARIKFDTNLDPIQWGTQLLKVSLLKDFPRLIQKINVVQMIDFFLQEAKKSRKKILS